MEKKSNTTERLKEIMEIKNLRQVDILELCQPFSAKYDIKMNKSDLSQYLSGKSEPNQNKLFILANALNVSEAWLMGLDSPMERQDYTPPQTIAAPAQFPDLSEQIKKAYGEEPYEALQVFSRLDTADRAEIRGEMKQMLKADKYAAKKGFSNGQAM